MLRRVATLVLALSFALGARASTADACGIKLAVKAPRAARQPIRTNDRPVVTNTREKRQPIAAGPRPTTPRRSAVVTPPLPPPAPASTPAPVAAPPPAIAPTPVVAVVESAPPVDAAKPAPAFASSELYFRINGAAVDGRMKRSLDQVARFLAAHPTERITIEGHADPSGTPEGNLTLSQKRADAVRDYLVAAGVDGARIEVVAAGDTQVKYGIHDGRNRRVAIVKVEP